MCALGFAGSLLLDGTLKVHARGAALHRVSGFGFRMPRWARSGSRSEIVRWQHDTSKANERMRRVESLSDRHHLRAQNVCSHQRDHR